MRVPGIEYTHAIPVCVCLTEVRRYLYYRADACDKPKASTPSPNCVEQWALRSIADEDLRKDVIERLVSHLRCLQPRSRHHDPNREPHYRPRK